MNHPVKPLESGAAIMLCGHGSRNQNAAKEFSVLADKMRERHSGVPVEHGYLEFCKPTIRSGLDRLRDQGAKRILAVPGMLFAAGHAKNDIPSVLNRWAKENPQVSVEYGRELGVDLKMLRAAADRIEQALANASQEANASEKKNVPLEETLLLTVGRGASDPDANSNVAKVCRMLWEGMGFGWAETAYSGVTFPLVEPALEHAARLGYKRIVAFPYFLFTGVLVKRIYAAVDAVARRHPDIEFIKAGYIDSHPLALEALDERIAEIVSGLAVMNCQMCKYREQALGFEDEVGATQASHHHHVEGIGGAPEGCPCKGDCDGSCRDEQFCRKHGLEWTPLGHHHHAEGERHHDHGHHHHHHHPYPHANHPLGPESMKREGSPKGAEREK